ncbi:hypothetical protein HU200_043637 [Digitaria exilis]|uniref:AP2/ERF domain-containing protein n=1 Tax=Digitaria exilis TaxID=1010633 RepID=A0A835BE06_9POAL|nr:hypothetical protein HU200_043637 [Digitaria exilis]
MSLPLVSGKDSLPVDLPKPIDNEKPVEVAHANVKPFSVHPLPPTKASDVLTKSSNGSDDSKEEKTQYYPGKEIKRRKRHRRKQYVDQEPCIMRGVYFKNMKWQAAIKVDKKQIHLGTVGTQDEAARLYDRAAFMCGREPNFELSEEEKQELRNYTWEGFLAVTRTTITSKKQRKVGLLRRSKQTCSWGRVTVILRWPMAVAHRILIMEMSRYQHLRLLPGCHGNPSGVLRMFIPIMI